MRILVISQYFWPENFRINDLCLGLKERGHDVTVLTGLPNYPNGKLYDGYTFFKNRRENWKGIALHRSFLITRGNGSGLRLFLNYFSFAFFASLRALFIKGGFDKIIVYEPSPITVGIPAIVASLRFGAPIFFWVQDLWPESLKAAGGITNTLVLSLFDRLTRFIYNRCRVILIQSKAFKPYLLKQGVPEAKLVYYPNSTESFYCSMPTSEIYNKKLPIGFKLIFAGNIGDAQSFPTLIDAAAILKKRGVKVNWIIIGEGRALEQVENSIKQKDLKDEFFMLGSFPSKEMPFFFSCADALLVSLKNEAIFDLTIPSKIQSYLACGKPIIASLNGEGARIIEYEGAGLTSPAEDCVTLANNIEKFILLPEMERIEMGKNALSCYQMQFERELLLEKLDKILLK